ncbi:Papain inhibitor [Cytospora mali]|uniref:Papain inhibitor n=1 Tax=Cytospora mali TaxID=578113 RepID=A0A194WA37_CYTMA|nr:Papain inhibitor [Valsa mali]
MKSTTASLIITALASTVIAQPHGHGHQHPARAVHQHDRQEQKRDLVTEWEIEWVTETVTEYIQPSTTEYFYPTHSASTPSTTLATVTTSPTPGDFLESASSSSSSTVIAPVETPSSSSTYVAPPAATSSSTYVAPPAPTTSSSTSEVYVAPETTTSTTPVETPTTTSTPVVETPTTTSTSVAAAATTAASDSGSTVSVNTDVTSILGSDFFSGDLTYYTLGLGACGIDNSGQDMTANIVAMSATTMGSQSNGNPMCGKTIKIYNSASGKTATGIIQDKCPGCAAGSIDVSEKLFEELADLASGRVEISWNWA